MKESLIALGRTLLRVSPVGVGTNSWGVHRSADPGKQPAFDALLSHGINFLDTAEIYTMGGSERTIGRCLAALKAAGGSAAPEKTPVILSKFFPMPWRLRGQDLGSALKRSLSRLGMTSVDVYLLHYPMPPLALETWMHMLADAVEAGLARSVGISNCDVEQTRRAHAVLAGRGIPLACNEVEYSLLRRGPERSGLLSLCRDLQVTLIAYRPLAMGMLAGTYSPEHPPRGIRSVLFGRRFLASIQPLLAVMRRIGERRGKSISQVAVNWVMAKGALPIPGVKNERQARENAGALGWRLTAEESSELEAACP